MLGAAPPAEDGNDDWVQLAMRDDVAVVGVLLDIRHAPPPTRRHAMKLEWSVRQRRSNNNKHVLRHQGDDVVFVVDFIDKKMNKDKKMKKKNKGEEAATTSTRASPTTPLSWSGATTVSGGGSEESSKPPPPPRPKPTDDARSKVALPSCTTISKRARKRKTLAQLKEEESLLLKERRNLKKELLTLRQNVEKQRATNESFKRLKLQQRMVDEQVNAVSQITRNIVIGASQCSHPSNLSCAVQEVGNCREVAFPLPDLNLPFEDDHNESLCGIS